MADYLRVQNLLPAWLASYLQALSLLGIAPDSGRNLDRRVLEGVMELDRLPLSERFSEEKLLLHVAMGRSQYDALFVAALGMTPRRYLELRRLEAARNLLTHSEESHKEISYHLGFRHESHFSLWFKKLEGMTASRYRQQNRANHL